MKREALLKAACSYSYVRSCFYWQLPSPSLEEDLLITYNRLAASLYLQYYCDMSFLKEVVKEKDDRVRIIKIMNSVALSPNLKVIHDFIHKFDERKASKILKVITGPVEDLPIDLLSDNKDIREIAKLWLEEIARCDFKSLEKE